MQNHSPKWNIVVFLRQVNLRLDGGKNVAAMAKFQNAWGVFHHLTLMDNWQLSEVCLSTTSCLCPTFPVNGLVSFCFLLCARCWICCCGWITKLEGSISLPYCIGNRQISYSYISALIFGWMDVIPFLKGNGINKKPIIVYIDFQVTMYIWCIVNAPKSLKPIDFGNSLHFWVFHIFISLVFILLFQQA